MSIISDKNREKLFKLVRVKLGAPYRPIQLDDDTLCTLLESCVEDYAMEVQNWLVENQWMSLYGKKITQTDMAFGLSVRSMDMMRDYSYWFSKEVGLQQRGPWELKKDYIEIEAGKQDYIIPAGREINKVLYMTPPTTNAALFANMAGIDVGFGGGYAQMGSGSGQGPMAGYYVMPAYDTMLLASDLNLKQRLLRSDMVYKVTGGPNGTKILHLLSTPGSRFSFGYATPIGENGASTGGLGLGLVGCNVWYTYYDVSGDDVDDCRLENPDILITPDQVPLTQMKYEFLNEPTKVLIRKLLIAEAKITLGNIRGTYSGKVQIPKAEMMLDYQMLHTQGEREREEAMKELRERLIRMNPENQLEKQAKIVQNMLEIKKGTPLPIYVK